MRIETYRKEKPEDRLTAAGCDARSSIPQQIGNQQTLSLMNAPAKPLTLPGDTRDKLESRLGYNLSKVKLTESPAVAQLGEGAYAKGDEIRFAPGAFSPGTPQGEAAIAHEMAHIVQQAKGMPSGNGLIDRSPALEAQAGSIAQTLDQGTACGPLPTLQPAAANSAPAQGLFGFGKRKRQRQEERQEENEENEENEEMMRKISKPGIDLSGLKEMDSKRMNKVLKRIMPMADDFKGLDLDKFSPKHMNPATEATMSTRKKLKMNKFMFGRHRFLKPAYFVGGKIDKHIVKYSAASRNFTGVHELGHTVNVNLIQSKILDKMPIAGKSAQNAELGRDWEEDITANEYMKQAITQTYNAGADEEKAGNVEDVKFKQKVDHLKSKKLKKNKNWTIDDLNEKDLKKLGYTSRYGKTMAGEMFAEAFADYYKTKWKNERIAKKNDIRAQKQKSQKPLMAYNPVSKRLVENAKAGNIEYLQRQEAADEKVRQDALKRELAYKEYERQQEEKILARVGLSQKKDEVPEGNIEVPEGDNEVPEGNIEVPEGDNEVPQGNIEVPEGDNEVPEGNNEVLEEGNNLSKFENNLKDVLAAQAVADEEKKEEARKRRRRNSVAY